jgi:hypothetical protein
MALLIDRDRSIARNSSDLLSVSNIDQIGPWNSGDDGQGLIAAAVDLRPGYPAHTSQEPTGTTPRLPGR